MSGSDYTLTPNLGLFKPTYNADAEKWGDHINLNSDVLDSMVLPLSGGTMTGPLNLTATGGTVARSVQDRWAGVTNVLDFGAKCDGTTDDTAAVNAAIAYVLSIGGGIVSFPRGTCLMLGPMIIPYTGTTNPLQAPIRLTGAGYSPDSYLANSVNGPSQSGGATILDLRYGTTPDGTHLAKIDTRGAGALEIDHLAIKDGGTSNYLMLRTTNTTLNIHDVVFIGNPANSGTACVQDAILLGGASGSILATNDPTSGFQGYGTRIRDCHFSHIRVAVGFNSAANAIWLSNNTTDCSCGSAQPQGAPYVFYGAGWGTGGCTINAGIVELTHYPYAVALVGTAVNNLHNFTNMGLYDQRMGSPTIGGYYFSASSTYNMVIPAYIDANLGLTTMNGPGAATNTLIQANGHGETFLGPTSLSGTLTVAGNDLSVGTDAVAQTFLSMRAASNVGNGIKFFIDGTQRDYIGNYAGLFGGAFDYRFVVAGYDGLVLSTHGVSQVEIDDTGRTIFNHGVSYGQRTVASVTDYSQHISLYDAGAGMGILNSGQFFLNSAWPIWFYRAGAQVFAIDTADVFIYNNAKLHMQAGFGVWNHAPPAAVPVVTGAKGGSAALASLLTALVAYGLVTDSTTA